MSGRKNLELDTRDWISHALLFRVGHVESFELKQSQGRSYMTGPAGPETI